MLTTVNWKKLRLATPKSPLLRALAKVGNVLALPVTIPFAVARDALLMVALAVDPPTFQY